MSQKLKRNRHYWVSVFELADVTPRRHPKRPNLYVALSMSPPERHLQIEFKRTKPRWYSQVIVRDRTDLAPKHRYNSREPAAIASDRLITRLKRDGYTVNRDTKVWTVYVVELDPSAVSKPGRGFLYVGETSLTPEERFKQHRDGARNKRGPLFSRVVHNHGVRLRPDLAPRRTFFDQASARKA
jgi:hypothetical protein